MRLFAIASLIPLAAASAAQVYLHPSPPHAANGAPTLTAEQAKAVMEHHLGVDLSGTDTPADEGVWSHLVHIWDHGEKRPRVVILEGADAQDVLPSSLNAPAFYLDEDAESAITPFIHGAEEALETVAHIPAVKQLLDTLDLASTKIGQQLSKELSALTTLAENMWQSAESAWDAVCVRFSAAERGSELWETASKGLKASLTAMTESNQPPLLLVVMSAQDGSRIHKRALIDTAAKKNSTRPGKGKKGGRIDYSAPFALLAGTTIFLVVLILGATALLFSIGDTALPSTLTLAVGGRKHD